MVNFFSRYIFVCILFLSAARLSAQVVVEQTIDSVGILIGEQAHLKLTVTVPASSRVEWPKLKAGEYVVPGVEVVSASPADTLSINDKGMKIGKTYTITSFDEHLYSIPALPVRVNGHEYKGGISALKVVTVDVDTLHPNQFFPPKDVQDNPFLWSEWRPFFWLSALVLVLLAVICYLAARLMCNKPVITRIRIVKHVPPHQRALSAIAKIKEEHMNLSEDQKTYYTRLTDTLRQYIKERFRFNAMEMTSSEIISHLQASGDKKTIAELRELFNTADLVKFAKYSTLINENDLNLVNAINFIDETKQEGKPTEERIVPKLSESDKQVRHSRMIIKMLLWGLGAVVVILFLFVGYHVWLLMQ